MIKNAFLSFSWYPIYKWVQDTVLTESVVSSLSSWLLLERTSGSVLLPGQNQSSFSQNQSKLDSSHLSSAHLISVSNFVLSHRRLSGVAKRVPSGQKLVVTLERIGGRNHSLTSTSITQNSDYPGKRNKKRNKKRLVDNHLPAVARLLTINLVDADKYQLREDLFRIEIVSRIRRQQSEKVWTNGRKKSANSVMKRFAVPKQKHFSSAKQMERKSVLGT